MWNRLDEDFRDVVLECACELEKSDLSDISTFLLLSQILKNDSSSAVALLSRLSIDTVDLKSRALVDHTSEVRACGLRPALTVEARDAVDRSYQLARDLGDDKVGAVHLLLSFLQKPAMPDACCERRAFSGTSPSRNL